MFRDDDDGDDQSAGAVTRYPCMPSLIALQQMRNRLHLAYVGKRLMKWTAQATGRELRNIAAELMQEYINYREEIKEAYILLARARYFFPDMNKMVLEHVIKQASIKIDVSNKSISGVKILLYEILDNGQDSYRHLGIGRGGQAILEAKQVWRDLLKKTILILHLRESYSQVEHANRSATKRMNVLCKMVIPKTRLSIEYINQSLEELERENFFRLKKVLSIKYRKQNKKIIKNVEIPTTEEEDQTTTKETESKSMETCVICEELLHPEKSGGKISIQESDYRAIEEFKAHINEIVELTKDIDGDLVSINIKDFWKSSKQLKDKLEQKSAIKLSPIPLDIPVEKLCDHCRMRFDNEQAAYLAEKEKSLQTMSIVIDKVASKNGREIELDLELGTIQTEIQEIIKVVRVMNEDGSITEGKKVIKIRRILKDPSKPYVLPLPAPEELVGKIMYQSSETSNKSTPYNGDKTIGIATVKGFHNMLQHVQNVKSEVYERSPLMTDPVIRNCLSSSFNFSSSSISYLDTVENISVEKLRDLIESNTNFEDILRLLQPHTSSKEVPTSNIEVSCSLTQSEINLLDRISTEDVNKKKTLRFTSDNDLSKHDVSKTNSLNINSYESNQN